MLVEFSLTCIFQHVLEKFFNYGVHIPRKSLNRCFFTHAPVLLHSKLLVELFGNLFPQRQTRWEEAMICSIKFQSEMKMTWNISLFPFGTIAIFLNVMALQFWK